MKKSLFWPALLAFAATLRASSLVLEQTIPLPGVSGRIDHFGADVAGGRLFVAALGNDTVEVMDLRQGKVVHTIRGLSEPQGIVYVRETDRLYVANGGDGTLRSFDGTTYAPVSSLPLGDDADNVRYDSAAKQVWVGYGSGALAIVDAASGKKTAGVPVEAHPESFQLEMSGDRIFVNVPRARQIAVVDRVKLNVTATWATGSATSNFPMALDEPEHRLLIGCRSPGRMIVLDTESGRIVAALDLDGDCDDLFFDAASRQIYATCGKGFIDIFTQADADHYSVKERLATVAGARTGSFDGQHLYLAVPRKGDQPAVIRCYRVNR